MGDARQVHLARWARYFEEAGYDVLSFSLEPADRFPGRVRVAHVPPIVPRPLRYAVSVPLVRRLVREFSPDVVNAHFVPNYGFMAAVMGRKPFVVSTWGSDIMTNPDKSPFHRLRARFVLRRASYVTSDAEVMTERLVSMGVPRDRILTFPFGVDTRAFHPHPAPPGEGPRILSNRKLSPVYSVSTLIDAFPAVREVLRQATLTIAGDGELRSELAKRAERSIARRAIVFVGSVDHERVPVLLRDHHIYVSTSLTDTTSVSLLEAMACGLFPVVSDIPANHEWIEHGTNGMFFPAEQPMKLAMTLIEAWKNEELRRKAAARNLEMVRSKADWFENMGIVRTLFDKLVAENRAPTKGSMTA